MRRFDAGPSALHRACNPNYAIKSGQEPRRDPRERDEALVGGRNLFRGEVIWKERKQIGRS